jgi:hypothetical protein
VIYTFGFGQGTGLSRFCRSMHMSDMIALFGGHLRVCLISKSLLVSKFFACCLCRNVYDIIMYMMLHNLCTPGDKSIQQLLCAMQLATRYTHYKCKFQITRVSRRVGAVASVACNDQCRLGLLFFLVLSLLQCNYLYGKALGLGLYCN